MVDPVQGGGTKGGASSGSVEPEESGTADGVALGYKDNLAVRYEFGDVMQLVPDEQDAVARDLRDDEGLDRLIAGGVQGNSRSLLALAAIAADPDAELTFQAGEALLAIVQGEKSEEARALFVDVVAKNPAMLDFLFESLVGERADLSTLVDDARKILEVVGENKKHPYFYWARARLRVAESDFLPRRYGDSWISTAVSPDAKIELKSEKTINRRLFVAALHGDPLSLDLLSTRLDPRLASMVDLTSLLSMNVDDRTKQWARYFLQNLPGDSYFTEVMRGGRYRKNAEKNLGAMARFGNDEVARMTRHLGIANAASVEERGVRAVSTVPMEVSNWVASLDALIPTTRSSMYVGVLRRGVPILAVNRSPRTSRIFYRFDRIENIETGEGTFIYGDLPRDARLLDALEGYFSAQDREVMAFVGDEVYGQTVHLVLDNIEGFDPFHLLASLIEDHRLVFSRDEPGSRGLVSLVVHHQGIPIVRYMVSENTWRWTMEVYSRRGYFEVRCREKGLFDLDLVDTALGRNDAPVAEERWAVDELVNAAGTNNNARRVLADLVAQGEGQEAELEVLVNLAMSGDDSIRAEVLGSLVMAAVRETPGALDAVVHVAESGVALRSLAHDYLSRAVESLDPSVSPGRDISQVLGTLYNEALADAARQGDVLSVDALASRLHPGLNSVELLDAIARDEGADELARTNALGRLATLSGDTFLAELEAEEGPHAAAAVSNLRILARYNNRGVIESLWRLETDRATLLIFDLSPTLVALEVLFDEVGGKVGGSGLFEEDGDLGDEYVGFSSGVREEAQLSDPRTLASSLLVVTTTGSSDDHGIPWSSHGVTADDGLVKEVQRLAHESGSYNLFVWFGDEEHASLAVSQVDLDNVINDAYSAVSGEMEKNHLRRIQHALGDEKFKAVAVMVLQSRDTVGHGWIAAMAEKLLPSSTLAQGGLSMLTNVSPTMVIRAGGNVYSLSQTRVASLPMLVRAGR